MAFPVIQTTATSQNSTSATSQSATLPSGIASGDLLIVCIASPDTSSTPAGWTKIGTAGLVDILYRVADGSEGASLAFTFGVAARHATVAYRITGYVGTPEAASQASSYDVPSLAPSWGSADTLWLATIKVGASDYTINGAPSSYTNLLETGNTSNVATTRIRVGSARRELAASSEDPGSFTVSGGSAALPISALIAVRGTAAGGGRLIGSNALIGQNILVGQNALIG